MKCNYCDQPVFSDAVKPAMCLKHLEASLLRNYLRKSGQQITAANGARALAEPRLLSMPWSIQSHQLEQLFQEVS